jgi:hypothetical protein
VEPAQNREGVRIMPWLFCTLLIKTLF